MLLVKISVDLYEGTMKIRSQFRHIFIEFLIILVFQIEVNKFLALCTSSATQQTNRLDYVLRQTAGGGTSNNSKHLRPNRSVYLAQLQQQQQQDPIQNQQQQQNEEFYSRNVKFGASSGSGNSFDHQSHHQHHQEQPSVLEKCCACDEAKYELVFEGLWSRYTHPDDFPENYWLAHFSDIIGASHSDEFRMWAPNSMATEGVRELAETGQTKKLESELKLFSTKTRTIIKARELRYPTLDTKTSAVFRTDRQHHLVSILSKLGPSPDWMVGVSALELCQLDCTWATQRVVNLYLWDAGTDSGVGFVSSDLPTRPQERIHPFKGSKRISSNSNSTVNGNGSYNNESAATETFSEADSNYRNSNNNNNHYFNQYQDYSSSQAEPQVEATSTSPSITTSAQAESIKPFARLTVTRQRIYEKSCNASDQAPTTTLNIRAPSSSNHQPSSSADRQFPPADDEHHSSRQLSDCRFTDWSDWSSCSSTCGKGIRTRTRAFLDEQAHQAGCSQADLIEKEICLSECFGNHTTCVTRDWSDWTKCSINCGQGSRQRKRTPIGPMTRACESVEFVETEPCTGPCVPEESPRCEVTEWSQWSECSVACGKGTRIRTRRIVRREDADRCNVKLIQKAPCTGRPELCKQVPNRDKTTASPPGLTTSPSGKRQINPNLPVIDCKLSNWSPWSTCSALCGNGRRTRSRHIIQMPQNGGKPCDKRLTRTQLCKDLPPCPPGFENYSSIGSKNQQNLHHTTKEAQQQHRHSPMASLSTTSPPPQATQSTTSSSNSMMDDEDDTDRLTMDDESAACKYGNWSEWSECEVVCQPVQKGSNKVRRKHPIGKHNSHGCQTLEELYFCDPKVYC